MKRFHLLLTALAISSFIVGCQPASVEQTKNAPAHDHDHAGGGDHGHDHEHAPHDGALFDWGGGTYHVEFTVDHNAKQATVYILGSDAKTPQPIKAEKVQLVINDPQTEVELTASPLDGEKDGVSSRFVGTHDTLGIVKEYAGTVSGVVDGTPYTGDFKEEAHAHAHP